MSNPRNKPCPCGSGMKFKRCCGQSTAPILYWILSVAEAGTDWTQEEMEYWREQGHFFPLADDAGEPLQFEHQQQAAIYADLHYPGAPFEVLPVRTVDLPELQAAVKNAEAI